MVRARKKMRALSLIATAAARLSCVIHHTLSNQMECYPHPSGRTARTGNKGMSIALVDPKVKWKILQLETKLRVSFSEYRAHSLPIGNADS